MSHLLEIQIRYLKTLIDCQVDFLVAGGYAVIYHGYVRTTGDIDIWLKPDNDNKKKLLEALVRQGLQNDSLEYVSKLDFTTSVAFHIGQIPEKLDFFTSITGLDFDTAKKNSVTLTIHKLQVPFLSLSDLIINKMMTTRHRDQVDVEELQKIMKLKDRKTDL
jgi:Nucleotidyl transferase of unknown function (DUF2204)